MESPEYALIVVNLIAGFGCAFPIAKLLSKVSGEPRWVFRYFAVLIGIYFVEGVAMVMAMGTPVFSVGLAFVWGVVFGLWLRARASRREALKTSLFLSLYSSLPAASFIVVPMAMWVSGWHILSAEEGVRFGIPALPHLLWPLNTILGFYAALVMGAALFKTAITMGEVGLLIRLGERPTVGSS